MTHRTAKRITATLCGLASVIGSCLAAAPALAQTPIFPTQPWTVQPPFADTQARNNISGAACADPPLQTCVAVNDVSKFAQFFRTSGTTIVPGGVVGIPDTAPVSNPRAEGAAHDSRFFYIVTSRVREPAPGVTDTSYLIVRFPVDTVRPPTGAVAGLEVSEKFRNALATGIAIPQIAGQQLIRPDADIAGIAVKNDVVHLGFRAPVISGKAFIVSVPLQALFGTAPFNPTVRVVALGPNVGIHDLAAVSDGLLILAGPMRDLADRPSLFHFNDGTGQVTPIAEMVEPFDRKAEGLLLLQEDPEFYRVLVLFDGVPDGGPLEYAAPR
jgi:hypothetical protein